MSKNGKGNTSTAVMNQRAPRLVEADDATRALWRTLDWFATPPWATRVGAELVKALDPPANTVWEPAAGDGIMAEALRETFAYVHASDIHPQRDDIIKDNFLHLAGEPFPADWIITNPPFGTAEKFLERGLAIAKRGVALLCRLNFLESAARYALFYNAIHPLTVCAVFSERVPMQLGPWDPDCSSATAYAWFIWIKHVPPASPLLLGIPPGTRQRLTSKTDIRRFVRAEDAPLFSPPEN